VTKSLVVVEVGAGVVFQIVCLHQSEVVCQIVCLHQSQINVESMAHIRDKDIVDIPLTSRRGEDIGVEEYPNLVNRQSIKDIETNSLPSRMQGAFENGELAFTDFTHTLS